MLLAGLICIRLLDNAAWRSPNVRGKGERPENPLLIPNFFGFSPFLAKDGGVCTITKWLASSRPRISQSETFLGHLP